MIKLITVVVLLLATIVAAHKAETLAQRKLSIPQKLARTQNPPAEPLTFSWDNCGINTCKLSHSV